MTKHSVILLIDDNDFDLLRVEEITLASFPHLQIYTATNGVEGLKVLEELYSNNIVPLLVISDINMPLMNGLETYSAIKNDKRFTNIQMVLFTTSSFSKKLFEEKGITAFVKLFSPIEYENTVLLMLNQISQFIEK